MFNNDITRLTEVYHMHASRQGPVLSNEIILAIKEKERNPRLKTIIGIQQPSGTIAHFLKYWLSGLEAATKRKMLNILVIENTRMSNVDTDVLRVLSLKAQECVIDAEHGYTALFLPLFEDYPTLGTLCNQTEVQRKIISLGLTNFENFMTRASEIMLNIVLASQNLPNIKIESVFDHASSLPFASPKFMNFPQLHGSCLGGYRKQAAQLQHASDFLSKQLKNYVRSPSTRQLDRLLIRFNANHSHNNITLSHDMISKFHEEEMIIRKLIPEYPLDWQRQKVGDTRLRLTIDQMIELVHNKYKLTLSQKPNDDDSHYYDGAAMVRLMYEIVANKSQKAYLAKQQFMRKFDYELYDELEVSYPKAPAVFTAFTTWDTSIFPEFDMNPVCALHYLRRSNVPDYLKQLEQEGLVV